MLFVFFSCVFKSVEGPGLPCKRKMEVYSWGQRRRAGQIWQPLAALGLHRQWVRTSTAGQRDHFGTLAPWIQRPFGIHHLFNMNFILKSKCMYISPSIYIYTHIYVSIETKLRCISEPCLWQHLSSAVALLSYWLCFHNSVLFQRKLLHLCFQNGK